MDLGNAVSFAAGVGTAVVVTSSKTLTETFWKNLFGAREKYRQEVRPCYDRVIEAAKVIPERLAEHVINLNLKSGLHEAVRELRNACVALYEKVPKAMDVSTDLSFKASDLQGAADRLWTTRVLLREERKVLAFADNIIATLSREPDSAQFYDDQVREANVSRSEVEKLASQDQEDYAKLKVLGGEFLTTMEVFDSMRKRELGLRI